MRSSQLVIVGAAAAIALGGCASVLGFDRLSEGDHATGRARCEVKGAYLATFTCADEWQAASVLVFDVTLLDAQRAGGTTPYAWTTGEPWRFETWNDGEPKASTFGCLWSDKNQRWVVAPCDATAFPLCEIGAFAR